MESSSGRFLTKVLPAVSSLGEIIEAQRETIRSLCVNKLGIWLYRLQPLKDSFHFWPTLNIWARVVILCCLLKFTLHPSQPALPHQGLTYGVWPGVSGFPCSLVSGLASGRGWLELSGREPGVIACIPLAPSMPWHGTGGWWPGPFGQDW